MSEGRDLEIVDLAPCWSLKHPISVQWEVAELDSRLLCGWRDGWRAAAAAAASPLADPISADPWGGS